MSARPSFALLVAAALLPACGGGTTVPTGPSDPALDPEESSLVYRLNRRREDAGIAATLTPCTALSKSASLHADDMRDKSYVDDVGLDGSTVRTRACAAGFAPGCATTSSMAELVGSGVTTGELMADQWTDSAAGGPVVLDPTLLFAGVGRSIGEVGTVWVLDLAASSDASCQ